MSLRMIRPRMGNQTGKENIVDVMPGLGTGVTRDGDRVMIIYQIYNKEKLFVDEGGPLELTLGNKEYGPEFDEGLIGVKVHQVRQIYMKPNKKLRHWNLVQEALRKLKLKRLPDYEYYQVSVVAMLDENGRMRTTKERLSLYNDSGKADNRTETVALQG